MIQENQKTAIYNASMKINRRSFGAKKMTKMLTAAMACSMVLLTSANSVAEPIDQDDYLTASEHKLENKKHQWTDGSRYEGEWLKHQPHGYGSLTYANGAQYSGRFKHGRREGQGIMKYENGDEYQGNWHDDQPHGKGFKKYAVGSVYEGQFKDGMHHGEGKQSYVDGTYYDGNWSDNKPHGYGQLTFISGGMYEGSFLNGRPEGKGRYYYPNGDVYFGDWKNGNQHGNGRVDFNTGGYYKGEYVDGMKHGEGVLVSALGETYAGTFRYNEAHGKGTCTVANNAIPCEYDHNKRVNSKVKVAKKPKQKDTEKVILASAAAATASVSASAAAATKAASESAAKVASAPAAAKPTPKKPEQKAKATKVAKAKESDKPMVFIAKPFNGNTKGNVVAIPATQQFTAKPYAEVAPANKTQKPVQTPKPVVAVAKKPAQEKARFTETLNKEKQKVKAMTVADLRQDKSDIYFKNNWTSQNQRLIPQKAYWLKRSSMLVNDMQIVSFYGDTEIRLQIKNYKGPGQYKISKAWVESDSQNLDADKVREGTLEVQSERDGWLVGKFSLKLDDDKGKALSLEDGIFHLANKDSLSPRYR